MHASVAWPLFGLSLKKGQWKLHNIEASDCIMVIFDNSIELQEFFHGCCADHGRNTGVRLWRQG